MVHEMTPTTIPTPSLHVEPTACPICGVVSSDPVAVGEDFEYRTSGDSFLAVRCPGCELVYLDPRPAAEEFARIYPDDYHAFAFDEENFGIVHRVRSRLEARRLLGACRDLGPQARILDVGCGDGFHLDLLRRYGEPGWRLLGVDLDERAASAAQRRGLDVYHGALADAPIPDESIDLVLLIQTIEHVIDPVGLLREVRAKLRSGGRLLVVTDNTASIDARLFGKRSWGGYHFPRHLSLFNASSLRRAATEAGLEVDRLGTMVTPVNWVYSLRNGLVDHGAPQFLVRRFSLDAPLALGVFTIVDSLARAAGRGGLLRAELRKPTKGA